VKEQANAKGSPVCGQLGALLDGAAGRDVNIISELVQVISELGCRNW
jgi:hypothetical protein